MASWSEPETVREVVHAAVRDYTKNDTTKVFEIKDIKEIIHQEYPTLTKAR